MVSGGLGSFPSYRWSSPDGVPCCNSCFSLGQKIISGSRGFHVIACASHQNHFRLLCFWKNSVFHGWGAASHWPRRFQTHQPFHEKKSFCTLSWPASVPLFTKDQSPVSQMVYRLTSFWFVLNEYFSARQLLAWGAMDNEETTVPQRFPDIDEPLVPWLRCVAISLHQVFFVVGWAAIFWKIVAATSFQHVLQAGCWSLRPWWHSMSLRGLARWLARPR